MTEAVIRIVVFHTDHRTGAIYLAPWLAETLIVLACIVIFANIRVFVKR